MKYPTKPTLMDKKIAAKPWPYNIISMALEGWDKVNLDNKRTTAELYKDYSAIYHYWLSKEDIVKFLNNELLNDPLYIDDVIKEVLTEREQEVVKMRWVDQLYRIEVAEYYDVYGSSIVKIEKDTLKRLLQAFMNRVMVKRHMRDITVYHDLPSNVPIDIMELPIPTLRRLRTKVMTMGELKTCKIDTVASIQWIGRKKLVNIYETANKYIDAQENMMIANVIRI